MILRGKCHPFHRTLSSRELVNLGRCPRVGHQFLWKAGDDWENPSLTQEHVADAGMHFSGCVFISTAAVGFSYLARTRTRGEECVSPSRLSRRSAYAPAYRGLKSDLNAGLVTEVALVLISLGETVAEAREHVIHLCGPNGDGV